MTYGSTEALPVSYFNEAKKEGLDSSRGIFLGTACQHTAVHIEPIKGITKIIPFCEYEIGEIWVKGAQVTPGYVDHPPAKKMTKGDTDPWHTMGDYGYVDHQGNLWMYGRISHAITHKETIYFPVPIEKEIIKHLPINYCTIALVKERLYLIIEKKAFKKMNKKKPELLERVNNALQHLDLKFDNILLYHKVFPFDKRHYSKMDRTKIQNWSHQKI